MFDNYIIEIQPAAAGITISAGVVVRDGQGFRFFAATHAFNRLEGQIFDTVRAAKKAALRHVRGMGPPPLRQNQISAPPNQ